MTDLVEELKILVIKTLNLEDVAQEDIDPEAPLFGDGLGLDSIDALELGIALQQRYRIKIDASSDETRKHFFSVNSLAQFITQMLSTSVVTSDELARTNFEMLKQVLVSHFEIDRSAITLDARLYDDLDIDSIDAVDLMVKLKERTGKKLEPEVYKTIRTVRDILDALQNVLST